MADIVHLILLRGDEFDWERLLLRLGEHWRLLLAQIHLYDYVYPGHRRRIPQWLREELYERAYEEIGKEGDRKSTRLNSSHVANSYAVFCLQKTNIILLLSIFIHKLMNF